MCGILLVKSKSSIPLEKHLYALSQITRRGPDYTFYNYKNNIFIGNTILHITGDDSYYRNFEKDPFFAFNGEIYNYTDFGNYTTDAEMFRDNISDLSFIKKLIGMYSFVYTDFENIIYGADPQKEKTLYKYADDDIFILSSEIKPILEYIKPTINKNSVSNYYQTKHFNFIKETIYEGIETIAAGKVYSNEEEIFSDTVFDWKQNKVYRSIDEAYEEFNHIIDTYWPLMIPTTKHGIAYSGGVDSSIILDALGAESVLYTCNTLGKDYISNNINLFAKDVNLIDIDLEMWADNYVELQHKLAIPILDHSFVNEYIISKACKEKVIFTGTGADELFGGYQSYSEIVYDTSKSYSPYSVSDPKLWEQCLEFYDYDPKPATLLMDFVCQTQCVDLVGTDMVFGCNSIEARSPFLLKPMIKFALNIPMEYKINKVLLRRKFLERWPAELLFKKQGFAGHCNDCLDLLPISYTNTGDRKLDWKNINMLTFNHVYGDLIKNCLP